MDSKAKIIRSKNKKGTRTANSEYTFHISSNDSNGELCIYEALFKNPGINKNLHYHKRLTETFTVLEGEFYFNIEDEEYILKSNDSLIVPPMVIHGFRSRVPNSRLQIGFINSKNRDDFFIELAQIINGEIHLNDLEKEAFYERFDQYNLK